MCCFFFQAEDGIRDLTVTGVQTCALPISGEKQSEDKKDNKGEPPEFALPLFKLLEAGREDGALVSVLCRPAGGLLDALVVFVHESGRTPQNRESSASKTYIHCRKASRISAIKAVKWSS